MCPICAIGDLNLRSRELKDTCLASIVALIVSHSSPGILSYSYTVVHQKLDMQRSQLIFALLLRNTQQHSKYLSLQSYKKSCRDQITIRISMRTLNRILKIKELFARGPPDFSVAAWPAVKVYCGPPLNARPKVPLPPIPFQDTNTNGHLISIKARSHHH